MSPKSPLVSRPQQPLTTDHHNQPNHVLAALWRLALYADLLADAMATFTSELLISAELEDDPATSSSRIVQAGFDRRLTLFKKWNAVRYHPYLLAKLSAKDRVIERLETMVNVQSLYETHRSLQLWHVRNLFTALVKRLPRYEHACPAPKAFDFMRICPAAEEQERRAMVEEAASQEDKTAPFSLMDAAQMLERREFGRSYLEKYQSIEEDDGTYRKWGSCPILCRTDVCQDARLSMLLQPGYDDIASDVKSAKEIVAAHSDEHRFEMSVRTVLMGHDQLLAQFEQSLSYCNHHLKVAGADVAKSEKRLEEATMRFKCFEEQVIHALRRRRAASHAELVRLITSRISELQQKIVGDIGHRGISFEPFIKASLDNSKVSAFPDTGAGANFMSFSYAETHGLTIDSTAKNLIRLGNGSVVSTLGTVISTFLFAGEKHSHNLSFNILSTSVHEVILGSPFLRLTETLYHVCSSDPTAMPSHAQAAYLCSRSSTARKWPIQRGSCRQCYA